jgi:uncharacterized protein (DUF2235 family)
MKKIVICCDGTGNEFGDTVSNVVKLYQVLMRSSEQITYYHPGLGTMGARNALTPIGKWWTKVIGLAFGYGISDNVADAYLFLMRRFQPGDEVYVFGFSRGAYTARALCGMLHIVGLLSEDNEALIPYAIRMIKSRQIDFRVAAAFKKTFSRVCKPHFLGVWDTVSSVGWIYNGVRFPFTKATNNPDLNIVRHAVSIDERRAFFRQNLVGAPHSPQQDVEELWFAGTHSDIGGGYPEQESQLSKIALRWMLYEAEHAGLVLDQERMADMLGGKSGYSLPDPLTKIQHESLRGRWWIAELWPKIVHKQNADSTWRKCVYFNLGRKRWIEPGPSVHHSVQQRIANCSPPYRPGNLPKDVEYVPDRRRSHSAGLSPCAGNNIEG